MDITLTYPNRVQQKDGSWKVAGLITFSAAVLDRRLRPYHRGPEVLIDNLVLNLRHWVNESDGAIG